MSDHGNGNNNRSIDKIIEHMTADVQNSDGQYIQLGFTPPSTPGTQHSWAEYPGNNSNNGPLHHYLPHSPVVTAPDNAVFYSDMQVPYEIDIANHITKQNELLQQHNFYYAPPRPQLNMLGDNRELISTMLEVGGGNVVNVVYGSRTSNVNDGTLVGQQYHLITPEGHRETVPHALGGFVPYHQESLMESPTPNMLKEYGLFGTNDQQQNRSFQHSQHYQQVQANNRGQLIENLVGNWVPNQSGTYSPFGCSDASLRPVPSTNQQTTQTVPDQMECENKGLGRGVRKTRIVAEVKPMRPSYSDVLTKSAPLPNNSSVVSKHNSHNSSLNNSKGDSSVSGKTKIGGVSKGSNKKNKNNALKRQHSSGSDEHNGNGTSAPTKVIQSPLTSRKSTGSDSKHNSVSFHTLPRKWVSLDDLDSDKQASKLEEEDVFDSGCSPKPASGTRNGTGEAHASKKSSRSKSVQQDEKWDSSPLNNKTLNFVGISTAASPSCSNGNGGKINGNGSGGGVNGVPAAGGSKRPIHINNNLGSSVWGQAKSGTTKNVKTMSEERKASSNSKESKSGSGRSCGSSSGRGSCVGGLGLSSGMQNGGGVMDKSAQGKRSQRGKKRTANSPIAMVCQPMKQQAWRWAQMGLSLLVWFTLLLYDVLGMSSKLLAHMGLVTYAQVRSWTNKVYRKMSVTVCKISLWPSNWWKRGKKQSAADGEDKLQNGIPASLENNISLPSTGEEAMKRLLACKGKDPYSILGVTPNSTDDDIKKYYKRQAFLVHPDKNNQPGAEEAFKILVHAFELIGEPERRKAYDRRVAETQQVEQAWSELNDLLSQLHQKMEYAANTIRCTNCGKRHRRVSVDRPCYAARMCSQCKIHHAAREGDIWAESSMLGFLWHYYACMDGAVYDITEWAACQADNLRHLRANTHAVQYRIVLGRQQAPPRHRGQESTSEPDLENFLNNLYSQSGSSGNGDSAGNRSDQARNRRKGKRKK